MELIDFILFNFAGVKFFSLAHVYSLKGCEFEKLIWVYRVYLGLLGFFFFKFTVFGFHPPILCYFSFFAFH
jgi:hypothetical protein